MYNYRYHLITVIAIFAALAIGLLLGVAITGSSLVQDTSNNFVSSLLDEFDTLKQANNQLTDSLASEQRVSSLLFDEWRGGRLNGRTVVLLAGTDAAQLKSQATLSDLIVGSGGAAIKVNVLVNGFGLDDPDTLQALSALIPGFNDNDAPASLANALLGELTYAGAPLAAAQSTAAEAASTGDTGGTAAGAAGASNPATESALGTAANTAADADSQSTQALAEADPGTLANYCPVTSYLIEEKIISVTVDYSSLLQDADSLADPQQQDWLQAVQNAGLAYAANGMVNLYVDEGTANKTLDATGLDLTEGFSEAGAAGQLPYLLTLPALADSAADGTAGGGTAASDAAAGSSSSSSSGVSSPGQSTDSSAQPAGIDTAANNYFALVVVSSEDAVLTLEQVRTTGLSAVDGDIDTMASYSIVALLSGAQSGIFGTARTQDADFPPIPDDSDGLAVFRMFASQSQ